MPAVVQEVGREGAAVLLQIPDRRLRRVAARRDAGLDRQSPALPQVARTAGGDDVLPCGASAARARHDMVEGQFVRGQAFAAILAGETVAQKNVEPCEGRPALLRYIFLEGDDARQP